jgi:molybdopterin synthase catalytic subunit
MVVKVQSEDFDIGAELSALTTGNTAIGGMTSFVGLVRDLGGEDALKTMTLEHYPGMTEKMLREIEAEANDRWQLEASLIVHRYGLLEPGDQIVLVATASAHRQASFDSSAFLIDWLKTKAPFWKLENTRKEGAHWVDAKTADDRAAKRWELPDKGTAK